MSSSMNTLRAVLVAGAAIAAVVAAVTGRLAVMLVMLVAIAAHGWMWWYQRGHLMASADRPRSSTGE